MDTPSEWLEVSGPSVDVAVQVALDEFGLDSPDQVSVEVIQEGKKGVLGLGGREAIVKVTRLPQEKKRRRRRRRRSGSGSGASDGGGDEQKPVAHSKGQQTGGRRSGGTQSGRKDERRSKDGGAVKAAAGAASSGGSTRESATRENAKSGNAKGGSGKGRKAKSKSGGNRNGESQGSPKRDQGRNDTKKESTMPQADISEQARVATEFLEGLLEAFGLEGVVSSRIDDDVLYLDVAGEQTEALVGARGTIMSSVLEITRTVVQRTTFGAPRMRLDIAGYAERRRTALTIYAGKLADRVKEEGNEVMLEPMNPADRKVVHDAVAEIDGVRSFSEGEDPNRAVVIAPD